MAIAFDTNETTGWVLAKVNDDSSNSTIRCNVPSSTVNGDLLIAVSSTNSSKNPTNFTPPGGWTQVYYPDYLVGTFTVPIGVWYRIASGEPSYYDWTLTADVYDDYLAIHRITGHDSGTPIDLASAGSTSLNGTSFTCPSQTTVTNNAVLVCIVAAKDGTALTGTDTGYPSGMTGLYSRSTGNWSSGINMGLAYEARASSGATGTRAWTSYLTGAKYGATVSFTIRPSSGSASVAPRAMLMGVGNK